MIAPRSFLIIASCLISLCASWEIDTNESTKSPLPVTIGEPFSLQCTVKGKRFSEKADWKVCTWSRDNDDAGCIFTYQYNEISKTFKVDKNCTGSMKDAEFSGSEDIQSKNVVCGMEFKEADEDDIAGWTCEIEQCDGSTHCETVSGIKDDATIKIKLDDQTTASPTTQQTTKPSPTQTSPTTVTATTRKPTTNPSPSPTTPTKGTTTTKNPTTKPSPSPSTTTKVTTTTEKPTTKPSPSPTTTPKVITTTKKPTTKPSPSPTTTPKVTTTTKKPTTKPDPSPTTTPKVTTTTKKPTTKPSPSPTNTPNVTITTQNPTSKSSVLTSTQKPNTGTTSSSSSFKPLAVIYVFSLLLLADKFKH